MGWRTELGVLGRVAATLPATVWRTARPTRPPDDVRIRTVPPPRASSGVEVHAITQNVFHSLGAMVVEGAARPLRRTMTMGAFLVVHEAGTFLVDAGLCADVKTRHLPLMPAVGRALLRGAPPRFGLADGIRDAGFDPAAIDFVLLTHLHWDHCSGLVELPGVPVRLAAAEHARTLLPAERLRESFVIPQTYDGAELRPVEWDGPPVESFVASHDLFGDGAALAVSLPGHTAGHLGVLLTLRSGRRVMLAGDAVWSAAQVAAGRPRPPASACLVDADRAEAYRSVLRLRALPGDVTVLPAHDLDAISSACHGGPMR